MKPRAHRFLPICEGALEMRQVLSSATLMSLASSAALPTAAPATPTPEVPQAQGSVPTLIGANAVKDGRGRVTSIEVHYSSKIDAATASNANNFNISVKTVWGHHVLYGASVTVASASYDDAQGTTTLVLSRPVASNILFVRPRASKSLVVHLVTDSTMSLVNQGDYKAVVS